MMKLNRVLYIWRCVFLCLILITLVLGLRTANTIQIDTNLADISPSIQDTPATRFAIKQLTKSIEHRILLLITGADEDKVLDADQTLRESLSSIGNISVLPNNDELADQLIKGISPYRFSLLNKNQRLSLAKQSADEIAQTSKQSLFGLSNQVRLLSFDEDPLAWHSDTLISFFANPSSGLSITSNNLNSTVLNIKIMRDALNMQTQESLTLALDREINAISQDYNVKVARSGVFFFAAHAATSSKKDISTISIGSTIGVVILLLFAFKSVRGLVLPFISVIFGVGFAFVITHTLYGKVHILTIVFGASLIGIVIDYSLHYIYHGAQPNTSEIGATLETQNSEKNALYRAMTLSLVTSLIGYAALAFSGLDALKKVALFSCCGLLMAWLCVICLGNLALRRPLVTDTKIIPLLVNGISRVFAYISLRIWTVIAALILSIAAAIMSIGSPFNDDPRVFFTAPQSLLESEREVSQSANDYEPGRYLIIHGNSDHQVYQRHDALFSQINASETFDTQDFTSLLTWVSSQQRQKGDYGLQSKLYSNDGAAQKLLKELNKTNDYQAIQAAYESAANSYLKPSDVLSILGDSLPPIWSRSDDRVVSFVLIRKGAKLDSMDQLIKPLKGVEYFNTLERTRVALSQQRTSATSLLFLAYALIAILVVLRFRNINALWLVTVPACSSASLIILSQLANFDLNLFHVMALFLVLGFGMDYTIFAREITHRQSVTLQAILLSAVTSLLSFGLLSLSSIPVVSSFGVTLLIGNLFNLFGVIIYAQSRNKRNVQN